MKHVTGSVPAIYAITILENTEH